LPIVLAEDIMDRLFEETVSTEGYRLGVDLSQQLLNLPDGTKYAFDVDPFKRKCLLEGLDDIGQTLQRESLIKAYEVQRQQAMPWLFKG
jgi:3-isopropylmalate/(R)-2-methylmalate dehydratase small subunit